MALPKNFVSLLEKFPDVSANYKTLSESCYSAGPLDRKSAHLIKLGMSIALMSEGGVHSHVRLAKEAGATNEEIEHVTVLAMTTLGWPVLGAAWSWIHDTL